MSEKNIGVISVDSLKLRIPIEKVKIIDPLLQLENIIVLDAATGQELDSSEIEFKRKSKRIKENGVSTRFAIELQKVTFKETREFLVVLFNSKLLKQDYFSGIQENNIETIYKQLVGFQVANFSLNDFLLGEVTDCDFKRDLFFDGDFSKMTKAVFMQTRETKESGRGALRFDKATNQGIQFSRRETTQFRTNPYLKVYHKSVELENNSREFRDSFLKGVDCENRIRIETTVKNRKHFRSLFGEDFQTTLKNVLTLTNDKKEKIFRIASNAHLQPLIGNERKVPQLRANDLIILKLIDIAMEKGNISFELIRDNILSQFENTSQKSKKKKQLEKLYQGFIKGSEADEFTINLQSLFASLGLN